MTSYKQNPKPNVFEQRPIRAEFAIGQLPIVGAFMNKPDLMSNTIEKEMERQAAERSRKIVEMIEKAGKTHLFVKALDIEEGLRKAITGITEVVVKPVVAHIIHGESKIHDSFCVSITDQFNGAVLKDCHVTFTDIDPVYEIVDEIVDIYDNIVCERIHNEFAELVYNLDAKFRRFEIDVEVNKEDKVEVTLHEVRKGATTLTYDTKAVDTISAMLVYEVAKRNREAQ